MIENLINYDISKYNSFVLETGLAKNKEEFLDTLYYKNSVLDMEYQKSMAEYAVRQDGISKYDEAMIGTVMIPAINDKDEYYMSRTNIGIDYLAKDAEVNLSAAKDTLKEIEINNDIIAKISAGNPTVEDLSLIHIYRPVIRDRSLYADMLKRYKCCLLYTSRCV